MLIYLQMIETEEDRTKFAQLYDRYLQEMFRLARRILNSDADAEDAVHQSFLALIRHLDCIQAVDSPQTRAYIAVITEHKAIDILRAGRRAVCLEDMDELPGLDLPAPGDLGLADAMARLPARYREMLLLRFDQGYSVREIARMLDSAPDAVRKAIWRAKQMLHSELEKEGVVL